MDKWAFLCIIISSLLGIIREVIKLKSEKIRSKTYNVLWFSSLVLIVLAVILYFI